MQSERNVSSTLELLRRVQTAEYATAHTRRLLMQSFSSALHGMPDRREAFETDPPILNGAHKTQNYAARLSSLHNEIILLDARAKPSNTTQIRDSRGIIFTVNSTLMILRRSRFDITDYILFGNCPFTQKMFIPLCRKCLTHHTQRITVYLPNNASFIILRTHHPSSYHQPRLNP